MRVGKWPLRHSTPIWGGGVRLWWYLSYRGGAVRGVLRLATPGSHEWFWADFFLLMTEIVYLGRSHKAFRNSSLGMTFAMSKLGVSKLFPEKKLWHLALAVGISSVGRNFIPCKFCLGKSLPSCLFLGLIKCISQGRNHMPCAKRNSSLQCNLHICLRWILILLYQ